MSYLKYVLVTAITVLLVACQQQNKNQTLKGSRPNIILVMTDDQGYGDLSCTGNPDLQTPHIDRLYAMSTRFTDFHVSPACSPTRAAIKSGRNHHVNNMGGIIETGTAFPGNTGQIPMNVTPVAEMLRLNGYSTGAFGKWHELAAWEASISGALDRWPTHQGFDKFCGFPGGENNQWAPFIYDGVTSVGLHKYPDYHFLEDMTDETVKWIKFPIII